MKILHLTLKEKWFDMIESGIKKEEYREIKAYWIKRLMGKHFDAIQFQHGYKKDCRKVTVEFIELLVGKAKPEWSDNWQGDVFILRLGDILNKKN